MWILGVIFAPIIEEFIYRWVLISRLSMKYSFWTSVMISSFLFWIIHWLASFIWAFIFWICAFIIYKKNDNIFASMFTHMLNNLSIFIFLTILFFFFPEEISSKMTLEDINSWIYYFLPMTIIWFSWIIYYIKKNEQYLKS
jgi:membrane protease YdiL (CAAX protease family)